MKKMMKNDNRSLTELEIKQLREQRNKIITNVSFVAAGTVDLVLLKMLSKTITTDDITANDLIFLLLGGGSCFLGSVLTGVNTIDYIDMKKSIYKKVRSKKK